RQRMSDREIDFELTPHAKDQVVEEGYDPAYGARPLRRTVQRRIENELARRILSGEFHDGQCVVVDFADGNFTFRVREGESAEAEKEPMLLTQ
ncbi:MAG: hypothetical protein ABIQ47_12590, partial [Tepidiformaceae bacterium]